MTGTEIIQSFEQYVDDTTELSGQSELNLLNKIYTLVLQKAWRFLYKGYSGTMVSNVITLPTDFSFLPITTGYSDISEEGQGPTVFVGPNYQPYKVVNFEDRRKYVNQTGYCYLNQSVGTLVFTGTPPYTDVQFDYIYRPTALTLSTSPVFPVSYHDVLVHGMAADDMICQIFDKARSYRNENLAEYEKWKGELSWWDSQSYIQG